MFKFSLYTFAGALAIGALNAAASEPEADPYDDGSRLYGDYCAVCHGSAGRGDGPLAPGLTVAPPNLRRLAAINGGIFPASRVRERIDGRDLPLFHGTSDMPVWGEAFKRARGPLGEQRVQQRLDRLIEHLQKIQDY